MTAVNTTVPNTSTSGTSGSDVPLPVATDSLDNSVYAALTAVIQMMRLTPPERNALMAMTQMASTLEVGTAGPRVRILLDAITASLTLATVTTVGTVTTVSTVSTVTGVTTVSTLTNMSQLGGRDATQTIGDVGVTAWASAVLPCIARS